MVCAVPVSNWECLLLFFVMVFRAVENLGGKDLVMNLVNHGNSDIKMQALLAIQKMMVQNWYVSLLG